MTQVERHDRELAAISEAETVRAELVAVVGELGRFVAAVRSRADRPPDVKESP